MVGLKRRAKKVGKGERVLTPRQKRAQLRRLVALEEEFGPIVPGGAAGGVAAKLRRQKMSTELWDRLRETPAYPASVVVCLGEKVKLRPPFTKLIDRVAKASGVTPSAVTVFEHLGSFAVVATAPFHWKMAEQPEVFRMASNIVLPPWARTGV